MSIRLLFVFLGLTACGRNDFPAPKVIFTEALARFDGDGNGTLSREEYERFDSSAGTFDKMDSSHDGSVDVDEFSYYVHANQPRALFSRKAGEPKR